MYMQFIYLICWCFSYSLTVLGIVCDVGWYEYNGHCYKAFTGRDTYSVAFTYCQGHSAGIVCIDDQEEMDFVHNTVYVHVVVIPKDLLNIVKVLLSLKCLPN